MILKLEIDETMLDYVAATQGWNGLDSEGIRSRLNDILVEHVRDMCFDGKQILDSKVKATEDKNVISGLVVKG